MSAVYYHPFFVHFVIALFLFSAIMDWLGLWKETEFWLKSGWYSLNAAALFLPFTIASGLLSRDANPVPAALNATLQLHYNFTLLAGSGILVLFLMRLARRGEIPREHRTFYLLLQLVTLVFLLVAAHSGGEIVYRQLLH